jgi:hypothetical protein
MIPPVRAPEANCQQTLFCSRINNICTLPPTLTREVPAKLSGKFLLPCAQPNAPQKPDRTRLFRTTLQPQLGRGAAEILLPFHKVPSKYTLSVVRSSKGEYLARCDLWSWKEGFYRGTQCHGGHSSSCLRTNLTRAGTVAYRPKYIAS